VTGRKITKLTDHLFWCEENTF